MVNDPANPGEGWTYRDAARITLYGHGLGENQTGLRITFADGEGGRSEYREMGSVNQHLYFRLDWTVTHESITLHTAGGGQEFSVTYQYDWLSGSFV